MFRAVSLVRGNANRGLLAGGFLLIALLYCNDISELTTMVESTSSNTVDESMNMDM